MKIFTSAQIHELDKYTIENEPISSLDLMERAAKTLVQAVTKLYPPSTPVVVFAGPGNNGGDALAMARMLAEKDYQVIAYLFNISSNLSPDCAANKTRLHDCKNVKEFIEVVDEFEPPRLEQGMLIIDGDVPSGLMTEDNSYNVRANIIRATMTLTLQLPKLAFLFAENQTFIGKLRVLDIRLSQEGINKTDTAYAFVEEDQVRKLLLERPAHAHKGQMGNALLIAGSYGMAGAAILATRACLRSGVGKVTVNTPKRNIPILQAAVPEAVVQLTNEETIFAEAMDTEDFDAMGIGPGIGQSEQTAVALVAQIRRTQCPCVADADALNILGNRRAWLQQLPQGIILTPHPKEFDRLEGHCADSYERLTKARNLAQRLKGFIILKGHHTAICLPDGNVLFNATGNAGMATAGSGDVLTGIITGLLARGYKQQDACILGVYLHGLAGDLAANDLGEESLMASDIIQYIPRAFKRLQE